MTPTDFQRLPSRELTPQPYSKAHSAAFDTRFEETWGLEAAGFGGSALEMGRFAQSNLLGGMGYFAGRNRLKVGRV